LQNFPNPFKGTGAATKWRVLRAAKAIKVIGDDIGRLEGYLFVGNDLFPESNLKAAAYSAVFSRRVGRSLSAMTYDLMGLCTVQRRHIDIQ
jgi:hypothetical protein